MYKSDKPIGFWSAVSMGIGAMVGAGIFALLGEAGSISGSAVYISFIIGGVIALFSGYSLGKLGARYPSAGGIVEYLAQAYGVGFFTGSMSIMLYFAAIGSISILFVHAVTHIGHLKIAGETDASHLMVLLAALFSLLAMIMALVYVSRQLGHILQILGGFVIVAVSAEILLQKIAKRKILPRIIEQK